MSADNYVLVRRISDKWIATDEFSSDWLEHQIEANS